MTHTLSGRTLNPTYSFTVVVYTGDTGVGDCRDHRSCTYQQTSGASWVRETATGVGEKNKDSFR